MPVFFINEIVSNFLEGHRICSHLCVSCFHRCYLNEKCESTTFVVSRPIYEKELGWVVPPMTARSMFLKGELRLVEKSVFLYKYLSKGINL